MNRLKITVTDCHNRTVRITKLGGLVCSLAFEKAPRNFCIVIQFDGRQRVYIIDLEPPLWNRSPEKGTEGVILTEMAICRYKFIGGMVS